jgi:protein-tyrosine-phosphatase
VPAVVLQAMAEVGVSLQDSFPKGYTDEMLQAADHVVQLGDGADVPVPTGVGHEHWDVGDPREASLDEVRAIRDELEARVADLWSRLQAPLESTAD